MENKSVSLLFSNIGKGADKPVPFSYTKIFEEHAPYYLSIGMTPAEYWNGDPRLVCDYRKAYELRVEHENFISYLTGLYIYNALIDASPAFNFISGSRKPIPYDSEPLPITKKMQEEKAERERNEWITKFKSAAQKHNELVEKKGENNGNR